MSKSTTKSTTKRNVKPMENTGVIETKEIELVNYEKLQQQLDEAKYFQSQTARQDLSGRMSYCKNCYFLKFDPEKGYLICNLDNQPRVENQVCAKNKARNEQ